MQARFKIDEILDVDNLLQSYWAFVVQCPATS